MHEVWKWELRLDDEERSGQGQYQDEAVESPIDDAGQSRAGARRLSTEPRERSPLSRELGNDSAEVEARRGVADIETTLESIHPAVNHMQEDRMTNNITVKKAIKEEELLPCHYFDFMYGTSTGGIIATILGRLRMTVTEGLDLYRKVGEDLFGKRRSHIPMTTKYHHEPLERAVREIVGSRCHEHPNCDGNDLHPWDADRLDEILKEETPFHVDRPRVCQTCCLAAAHDGSISEAHLLRSYPHYYNPARTPNWVTPYNEGADKLSIWQVTRATSAAPFYFEMLKTGDNAFKDGGIRENNPSGAALSEFHALYDESGIEVPALLLSVGTGRPDTSQDGFANHWPGAFGWIPGVRKFLEKRAVIQNLLIKYTDGEKQHLQTREQAHGEHTWYKRLNVSDGLQTMHLDEWIKGDWQGHSNTPGGQTLTRMEDVTATYLDREFDPTVDSYAPPSVMLRQAAEKLVRQRRARERLGGVRWDTFIGKYLPQPKQANGSAG